MNIEFTTSPSSNDLDLLTSKINEETIALGAATPFAFFIRDETGTIIGGANGVVLFGSIYTDQLWVDKNYRRSGYGKKLMEAVHNYGHQRNCTMATLCTMSFQGAKEFYINLGYSVDFERPGYTQNASLIYLKRSL